MYIQGGRIVWGSNYLTFAAPILVILTQTLETLHKSTYGSSIGSSKAPPIHEEGVVYPQVSFCLVSPVVRISKCPICTYICPKLNVDAIGTRYPNRAGSMPLYTPLNQHIYTYFQPPQSATRAS